MCVGNGTQIKLTLKISAFGSCQSGYPAAISSEVTSDRNIVTTECFWLVKRQGQINNKKSQYVLYLLRASQDYKQLMYHLI